MVKALTFSDYLLMIGQLPMRRLILHGNMSIPQGYDGIINYSKHDNFLVNLKPAQHLARPRGYLGVYRSCGYWGESRKLRWSMTNTFICMSWSKSPHSENIVYLQQTNKFTYATNGIKYHLFTWHDWNGLVRANILGNSNHPQFKKFLKTFIFYCCGIAF